MKNETTTTNPTIEDAQAIFDMHGARSAELASQRVQRGETMTDAMLIECLEQAQDEHHTRMYALLSGYMRRGSGFYGVSKTLAAEVYAAANGGSEL